MRGKQLSWLGCGLASVVLALPYASAQGVDVTIKVVVKPKAAPITSKHKGETDFGNIVVWLTPLQPDATRAASVGHPGPFRLLQKDKQFTPHLLVVPTGSNVEFPNDDPFFHNVFSLFNGKRFDLGLYESGSSRYVRFDREGVSYIFCNIHPQMGAVVLSLSTPYYNVSAANGSVAIHNVPPGSYRLHVWSETTQGPNEDDARGIIQVNSAPLQLSDIVLQSTANPMENHKNKFGDDYHPSPDTPY